MQEGAMSVASRFGAIALLGIGLGLSGCATPLEQCIAGASAEMRFIEEELTERRVNIARGYAIRREMRTEMLPDFCYSPFSGMRFMCMEPVQTVRETRRPINVADEQERIAQLERALERERRLAAAAIAQCRATYSAG